MESAAVGVTVGSSGSSVAVDDDIGIGVLVGVGGWGVGVSVKADLVVRVGFAEQPETRIMAANSRDVNFFILVLRCGLSRAKPVHLHLRCKCRCRNPLFKKSIVFIESIILLFSLFVS
jgi:hypothetical protein